MSPSLLLLVFMLPGTIFQGLYDTFSRKVLRDGMSEGPFMGVIFTFSGILLLIVSFIFGTPELQSGFWTAFSITAILNIFSQFLWVKAFKREEVSLISPLRLVTSVFVLLTGYLVLGEVPSAWGVAGVLTTIIGLYYLLQSDSSFRAISFRSLVTRPGVIFGFLGALLFAVSLPFDKQAVLASSGLFFSGLASLVIGIFYVAFTFLIDRNRFSFSKFQFKNSGGSILFLIVAQALGIFLVNHALNYSLVAYAASAKRLSSLWAVLFGGAFLHEGNIQKKFIATAVMIAGVALTALFG